VWTLQACLIKFDQLVWSIWPTLSHVILGEFRLVHVSLSWVRLSDFDQCAAKNRGRKSEGETSSSSMSVSGTDVMILKIFSPKKLAKKLAFFAQTTASFCKKLIITMVFEKNANFFRRKLSKIAEN
jgi:hypothetical protein